MEGKDSYLDTVIREAEEELGLTDIHLKKGPKQLITTPGMYFVQWYTALLDLPVSAFVIQPEEVEQVAWFSRSALGKELKEKPEKYIEAMPEVLALFP